MNVMNALSAALAFVSLTACHNYTSAPICSDANAVVPPGMTGVYTISVQDEAFAVQTEEYRVGVDTKGRMTTHHLKSGAVDEGRVCQVNGYTIQESFDKDVNAYHQSRLYVTGMGLTSLELFYDKNALVDDGISAKTFELPEETAKALGPVVSRAVERTVAKAVALFDDKALGFLIDNDAVYPEAVIARSYAAPIGLNLLRK